MNFPEITTKFKASFGEMYSAPDENYERGYDDGHSKGYDNGYAIGEAEGYKDGKADGIEQGLAQGIAEGKEICKQEEYDAFWDNYQKNGTRPSYTYAFYGVGWNDDYYKPKYPIEITTGGNAVFQGSYITDTLVPISVPINQTNTQIFAYAQRLKTIRKLIIGEGVTLNSSCFTWLDALENITIEGELNNSATFERSKNLTGDSIKNIVNALSSTATGKTLTLSKTAVNNATFGSATNATVSGAMSNFIQTVAIPVAENERVKVTLETDEGHYIGTDYDWGELKPDDWFIGITYGGEPCLREFILSKKDYTVYDGNTGYVQVWFATGGAANFSYTIRAVRIDENGNEIDGINLYNLPDGTYTDYNGTTYTLAKESWESLAASKPNWTITLA